MISAVEAALYDDFDCPVQMLRNPGFCLSFAAARSGAVILFW